ncbi:MULTISPECIES: hypothetical protein [Comamonas]|jgi:hypothetical protein|nr:MULTISPECIES: hypothetical protein [Comamonas]MDR3067817.1 hypothetical protein [Comamonas sp.]MEB5966924.1 hypothetical protein [Comamonas testosteroni]
MKRQVWRLAASHHQLLHSSTRAPARKDMPADSAPYLHSAKGEIGSQTP